jgi:hypothetical protein
VSVDRLETIRDCARRMAAERAPEQPRFRVVNKKGETLREFVGCEDATRFNTDTWEAVQVFRIEDGKAITQAKPRMRMSESAIDHVLARAAKSNGGVDLLEQVEELPDDGGEVSVESENDTEAA